MNTTLSNQAKPDGKPANEAVVRDIIEQFANNLSVPSDLRSRFHCVITRLIEFRLIDKAASVRDKLRKAIEKTVPGTKSPKPHRRELPKETIIVPRYGFLPFEAFNFLDPKDALSLFETYSGEYLTPRIELAHEIADPNGCFYGLEDWETAIKSFLEHQEANAGVLVERGYSDIPFEVSPWLDRHLGCLYPVKYRSDIPGRPWNRRTAKGKYGIKSMFGGLAKAEYPDASYLLFLDETDARRLDTSPLRNQARTLREQVLRQLLVHLRNREPDGIGMERALEIVSDCLGQGRTSIDKETVEFLREQDKLYEESRDFCLPNFRDSKDLHVHAGGLLDLARVIEQVTMEMAIRHRSNIWARLSSRLERKPPLVGIEYDLKSFYLDYTRSKGGDFEHYYQPWEASLSEQKAYSVEHSRRVQEIFRSYTDVAKISSVRSKLAQGRGKDKREANQTPQSKTTIGISVDTLTVCFSGNLPTGKHRKQAMISLAYALAQVKKNGTFDRLNLIRFLRTAGYRSSDSAKVSDFFKGSDLGKFVKKAKGMNQYTLNSDICDIGGSKVDGDLESLQLERK